MPPPLPLVPDMCFKDLLILTSCMKLSLMSQPQLLFWVNSNIMAPVTALCNDSCS